MIGDESVEWVGSDLATYLRNSGSHEVEADPRGLWVALDPPSGLGDLGVKVPLNPSVPDSRDAPRPCSRPVGQGDGSEPDQSQTRALLLFQYDTIEASAGVESHEPVRAELGLKLIKGTWDALVAAGLWESASQKRPVYRGRRSGDLTTYLSGVRLGFTRPGSYVVPFYSPSAPEEPSPGQLALEVESFERRVLSRFLISSRVAVEAAARLSRTGRLDQHELVLDGVSANLFRALAELPNEFATRFSVRLAASSEYLDRPVEVPAGLESSLEEARERLAGSEPYGEVSVVGYVRDLHREHEADSGEVGIHSAAGPSEGISSFALR